MRISDLSSDVCSSDLFAHASLEPHNPVAFEQMRLIVSCIARLAPEIRGIAGVLTSELRCVPTPHGGLTHRLSNHIFRSPGKTDPVKNCQRFPLIGVQPFVQISAATRFGRLYAPTPIVAR